MPDCDSKLSDFQIIKFMTAGFCLALTGCATYKESKFTPSGFNYTISVDKHFNEPTHYFGLSWDLK